MKQVIGLLAAVALLAACGQTPNAPSVGKNATAATGLETEGFGNSVPFCFGVPGYQLLDTSFGFCGKQLTDPGQVLDPENADQGATAVAIQADGKIILAGYYRDLIGFLKIIVTRLNTDGSLDTSFAGTGKTGRLNEAAASNNGTVPDIKVQPDGKILIALKSEVPRLYGAIYRLNPDGSPDGRYNSAVHSMALQADGKIVILTRPYRFPREDTLLPVQLTRLNSDLTIDTSFAITPLTNFKPGKVYVTPTGKIIVTGSNNDDTVALGFRSNGSVDTAFGTFGVKIAIPARRLKLGIVSRLVASRNLRDSVQQPDGKVVLLAEGGVNSSSVGVALARLNTNGAFDSSFGVDGRRSDTSLPTMNTLAVQANGNIVLGGSEADDFVLARFNSGGVRDATWGNAGKVITGFPARRGFIPVDRVFAMIGSSDGKIIAAGESSLQNPTSQPTDGFAIVRYKP